MTPERPSLRNADPSRRPSDYDFLKEWDEPMTTMRPVCTCPTDCPVHPVTPDTRTTENPGPCRHPGPLQCGWCGESVAEAAQGAAPRAEGLDVEEALLRYGRHEEGCPDFYTEPPWQSCICGWAEVLIHLSSAEQHVRGECPVCHGPCRLPAARVAPQEHRDKEACCLDCLEVDEAGTETGACEHPGCSCHAGVKQ